MTDRSFAVTSTSSQLSFLTVEMIIPCELLIKILEKVVPKMRNHYGCMASGCDNDPCVSEFKTTISQVLKLKGVNKQWKSVLETFVIKKNLRQMLFLHEQMINYLPYPRFILYNNGSEPFHIGLHPFKAEASEEVLLIVVIKGG